MSSIHQFRLYHLAQYLRARHVLLCWHGHVITACGAVPAEFPRSPPRRTTKHEKSWNFIHELAMSLYYETATILENPDKIGGSFKARIFKKKDLKSKPGQIYALVAEASKWSQVLKDVIEKCAILKEERKVRPTARTLAVLQFTVHMHPFSKCTRSLLTSTADASPRPPPHPRSAPQQVRRRGAQGPCTQASNHTAQSASQRCVHQSAHTAQIPHARRLPRSDQRRRP